MHSTRRNKENIGCAVLLFMAAALATALIFALPSAPAGPRYEGAGSEERKNGGTFVFHHVSNVRTLDPHIAYDELSGMALRLILDGLLDYDQNSNLIPNMAEALPQISEGGTVFRFRLRRGIRFHPMPGHPEGRELIAEDIAWSIRRLLSKKVGSPGYPFYSAIEGAKEFHEGETENVPGIQVLDRYTIEFRLTEPDQTFLNAMAMPFAYPIPKENVEHWGEDAKFHPVGTGPFVFDSWERGVRLTFNRNPHYWNERPGPDSMIFLENMQRELAALRFRNGGIDAIHRLTSSDYKFFKESEKWANYLVEFPRGSTFAIGMNCDMEPFDNVHLRRAVAAALDREGWSRARANRLLPAGQILPPSIPGYDPDLPELQTFDLDRAREEMRLAGYPNGLEESVTAWFTEGDTGRMYGELLQADLKKIGIDVQIRFVSFAVYLSESGKPNTVQMFTTGWNLDFPDPSNFLDTLFHSRNISPENSQNRSFFRNEEFDALLDEARSETDRERRLSMYRQANALIAREAPWAFSYYPLSMEIWQPYVKGYHPHPVWTEDYRGVWLDLPRRRIGRELNGMHSSFPAIFFPGGNF